MDAFEWQQELESLAGNASGPPMSDDDSAVEPVAATMARWQKLFGLSSDDAVERIVAHRNNLTRAQVSDAHWDHVRTERENQGYDREAYEYELELLKKKALLAAPVDLASQPEDESLRYLVELDGPLDTPDNVRIAAGLLDTPPVMRGYSVEHSSLVSLCCIDAKARTALLRWAGTKGNGWEPTILTDPRTVLR